MGNNFQIAWVKLACEHIFLSDYDKTEIYHRYKMKYMTERESFNFNAYFHV